MGVVLRSIGVYFPTNRLSHTCYFHKEFALYFSDSDQKSKADFHPSRVKCLNHLMRDEDEEGVSTDEEDPNFHEYSPAGRGILVFSPEKAGQDVTPANYTFPENSKEKRHSTTLTSIAGMYKCALMNFIS